MEFNPLRNSATLSGYACRFSHGVSPERPRNRAMNLFGGSANMEKGVDLIEVTIGIAI